MHRGVMLSVGLGLTCVMAHAQDKPARRSPFMPPNAQAAAPVAENSPIEFHGVMVIGPTKYFNFFEPTKRVSTWVKLNESTAPILVKSFDGEAETVSVEHGGRTMTLALQKVKVSSAPMPVAMTAPASVTPIEQPAAVLNPTPADEAKRLDAIAAEVRRRRLIRQQTVPAATPAKQN